MTIPEKMSKICWNYNNWLKPSGQAGKSRDRDSYEYKHGSGYEEWLFDFDKLIDGYHYAFLQPVGKARKKYENQILNITLYSYNSDTKKWYWVGKISKAQVIDENTSLQIVEQYRQNNWLSQMETDLEEVKADVSEFRKWENETLFNIRFKPKDVVVFGDNPVPFGAGEKVSHTRYTLLSMKKEPKITFDDDQDIQLSGKQSKTSTSGVRTLNKHSVEYDQLHDKIQNGFTQWLRQTYPSETIDIETGAQQRTRIDIVRIQEDKARIFYEVKACNSLKFCIRDALGQLLEYAYFPNAKRAKYLFVVSYTKADKNIEQYIQHLNKELGIPIGYIQFDYETSRILQEIKGTTRA